MTESSPESNIPLQPGSPFDQWKPFHHFGLGIHFYLTGLRMLLRHPSLLAISLVPIGATLLILTGLAGWLSWQTGELIGEAWGGVSRTVVRVLVFILALMVGYLIYLPLTRILLAPFSEALSRRAAAIHTGQPSLLNCQVGQKWGRAMAEGVRLVLFQLLLLAISFGIGLLLPPLAPAIGILAAILTCTLDFYDIPLAMRGMSLGSKLRLIAANPSLSLGFGVGAWISLFIPVVNIVLLPAGVIGATVLISELERHQRGVEGSSGTE